MWNLRRRLSLSGDSTYTVAILVGMSFALGCRPPQSQADQADFALARAVDSFVMEVMNEVPVVPGIAVAVVRGDRVVYERGFGYRDVEAKLPVTPNTVFYIASSTKSFTGMTAAVLAHRGVLSLEAPLHEFYPDLEFEPPLSADSITLRDLLRHVRGFSNGAINFITTWVGWPSDEELLRILGRYSRPEPRQFVYSNTAYALAGHIIERVAGAPWRDVMRVQIFEPLGMTATTGYLSEVSGKDVAHPYVTDSVGFRRLPMLKTDATITGAGGILSTAHDLGRWVLANLDEGRIQGRQALPAAAVHEAHRVQVELEQSYHGFDRFGYGLGWMLGRYDNEFVIHHFGGMPGFKAHISFMPDHRVGVVVLVNEAGDGSGVPDQVAKYIYDRLLERPDADTRARELLDELTVWVADARARRTDWETRLQHLRGHGAVSPSLPLQSYEGRYRNERLGEVEIRREGSTLLAVMGDLEGSMIPAGGHAFLVDWYPSWEPETFDFDVAERDTVTSFHWGPRPFQRIPSPGSQ